MEAASSPSNEPPSPTATLLHLPQTRQRFRGNSSHGFSTSHRPDLCTDTTTPPPPPPDPRTPLCPSVSPFFPSELKRCETTTEFLPPASSRQAHVKLGVISQAQLVPHLSLNLPPLTHFKTPPSPLPPLLLPLHQPHPGLLCCLFPAAQRDPDKKHPPSHKRTQFPWKLHPTRRGKKRGRKKNSKRGVFTADLLDGGTGRRGNPDTCGRLGARSPSPLISFDERGCYASEETTARRHHG